MTQRGIKSWEGFELQKASVRAAAEKIRNTADPAEKYCEQNGWDAGSFILRGISDPVSVQHYPPVKAASDAHRYLRDLTDRLITNYNLDFYLIRSEWAPILNPCPEEVALCQEALA